eukprot:GDKK01002885.1.p1 GENE.GDKK01002885.1~~GDKK01002885.1.p1  ORF type:complete len:124 (+),score=11.60 GDKK01002885.1:543-914(+)
MLPERCLGEERDFKCLGTAVGNVLLPEPGGLVHVMACDSCKDGIHNGKGALVLLVLQAVHPLIVGGLAGAAEREAEHNLWLAVSLSYYINGLTIVGGAQLAVAAQEAQAVVNDARIGLPFRLC